MNYAIEYTYPEQYITYLNDTELLQCLMEVMRQDSCCVKDTDMCKGEEESINEIAIIISKQFRMHFLAALSYVKDTIFKETPKRWLKKMTNQ